MFGNTEQVAHAVAQGLERRGVSTEVVEVSSAPADIPSSVELLVVGAPTHAFSLSRPQTRLEAVRQGAPAAKAGIGLREWLATALAAEGCSPHVAVYDTRVRKVRRLPAAAGPSAARLARRRGFAPVDRPVAFLVTDTPGPLAAGELDRASTWGRSLASQVRLATS